MAAPPGEIRSNRPREIGPREIRAAQPGEIRSPRKWIGWLFLAVVIVVALSAIGSTRDRQSGPREIDPLAADLAACDTAPQSLRCFEARQALRRRAEFVKRLDEEGALQGR